MQSVKIPQTLDPYRSAAKRLDYQGVIVSADLVRLASVVVSVDGDAEVSLSFDTDLNGVVVVEGTVVCPVIMECQRCGENMKMEVSTSFKYTPEVKKIEELDLQDQYDCAEINNLGEIDLYAIIEDELILALPLVARHSDEECSATGFLETYKDKGESSETMHKPFAELGNLIKLNKS